MGNGLLSFASCVNHIVIGSIEKYIHCGPVRNYTQCLSTYGYLSRAYINRYSGL